MTEKTTFQFSFNPEIPRGLVYLGLGMDSKLNLRAVFAWQSEAKSEVIIYAPTYSMLQGEVRAGDRQRAAEPIWPAERKILQDGLGQIRFGVPYQFMIDDGEKEIGSILSGHVIATRAAGNPYFTAEIREGNEAVPVRNTPWYVLTGNDKMVLHANSQPLPS